MFFRKLQALFMSHRDLHARIDKLETRVLELEARAKYNRKETIVLIEERIAAYEKNRDKAARERMGLLDGTQADVEHLRLENARGLAEDQGIPAEIRDVGGEERLIVGSPRTEPVLDADNRVLGTAGTVSQLTVKDFAFRPTIVDQVDAVLCERAREAQSPRHGGYSNGQGR